MRSVARVVAGLAVAAGLVWAGAVASIADASVPANPSANFHADTIGACAWGSDDRSSACLLGALHQFDEDLHAEGRTHATFALPSNWAQLTVAQQLFVLANEDRIARGLAPIGGMDACLTRDAAAGAKDGTDPDFRCGDPFRSAGANWSGANSPLYSEFLWVYDDGPGSGNLDCPAHASANASGCWGHRKNILAAYAAPALMGAADSVEDHDGAWKGQGGGEAEEFYGGDTARTSFTWASESAFLAHPITEASLRDAGVCIRGSADAAVACDAAPASAPAAPARVGAVRQSISHGLVHLNWAAPAKHGATITGYQVAYATAKGRTVVPASLAHLQRHLMRGTYSVTVRAHNRAGWGAWSAAVRVTVR